MLDRESSSAYLLPDVKHIAMTLALALCMTAAVPAAADNAKEQRRERMEMAKASKRHIVINLCLRNKNYTFAV